MSRGDLSEAEWRILKGFLPIEAENRGRGRRPKQNRSIVNGILWRLRCGTPWRDVPPKYGNWNTIDLPRDFHPVLIRAAAVLVMPFGALFAMGSGMPDPIAKIVSA